MDSAPRLSPSTWVFSARLSAAPRLRVEWPRRWPAGSLLAPRTSTAVDTCALRKLRSLGQASPRFSSPFSSSRFPRVSASPRRTGPAAGLSGVSSPQEHRQQSIHVLCENSAPSAKRPLVFLLRFLLRAFPASPRLRVERAPPLACREFPRPKNIDSSRYMCSAKTPLPRPSVPSLFFSVFFFALSPRLRVSASNGPRRWPVGSFLAPRTSTAGDTCAPRKLRSLGQASPRFSSPLSSSRFPRVSASPRRMGPAAGLSGVSSPQEHRQQSIRVLRGDDPVR